MSIPAKTIYKTTNWSDYNRTLRQRGSLTVWFDPEMVWGAVPSGKRGRQQVYSDAAIQASLTIKVLFEMALRQTTGFVASLLKLAGLTRHNGCRISVSGERGTAASIRFVQQRHADLLRNFLKYKWIRPYVPGRESRAKPVKYANDAAGSRSCSDA